MNTLKRLWREWREFWHPGSTHDPIAEWNYWQGVAAERSQRDEPTERIVADRRREAIYDAE